MSFMKAFQIHNSYRNIIYNEQLAISIYLNCNLTCFKTPKIWQMHIDVSEGANCDIGLHAKTVLNIFKKLSFYYFSNI